MQGKRKSYPDDARKTTVYQKSLQLVNDIYDVAKELPSYELYAMADQFRRSVTSITANIAEGRSSLYFSKEYSFLNNAVASCGEVRAFLDMAKLLRYITDDLYNQLDKKAEEIIKMLIGLMRWIDKQTSNEEVGKKC